MSKQIKIFGTIFLLTVFVWLSGIVLAGQIKREALNLSLTEEEITQIGENLLPFDLKTNYLEQMILAACNGDIKAGRNLDRLRSMKKSYLGIADNLSFDDLYLLAKIIEIEAGSSWLTEEHRRLVASVVVNRVASPEFPHSLEAVIHQPGQYALSRSKRFETLIPSEKTVRSAAYVLQHGSIAPASVVFQAEFPQGGGVYQKIKPKKLGTTYFCYSSHMEKYTDNEVTDD